jgi:hypothetical protein
LAYGDSIDSIKSLETPRFSCLDNGCLDEYYGVMGSESLTTNRKFDSQEQEVYLSLWRTYDRLKAIEDELFGEWQITSQQYNVLRILQAAAPDSVPTLQISNRLISRAPDITRRRARIAGKTARTCQVSARFPVRTPESNRSLDTVPTASENQKTP